MTNAIGQLYYVLIDIRWERDGETVKPPVVTATVQRDKPEGYPYLKPSDGGLDVGYIALTTPSVGKASAAQDAIMAHVMQGTGSKELGYFIKG